jgi:hypothetical protein
MVVSYYYKQIVAAAFWTSAANQIKMRRSEEQLISLEIN